MASFWRVLGLCVGALFFLGCGGPNGSTPDDGDGGDGPLECSDVDGDGYGTGASCAGPDCDDSNPAVFSVADCQALCATDPESTGCACDPETDLEPEVCYLGPAETIGQGHCRAGVRNCVRGAWSECIGQRLPFEEVCDLTDNDCDGAIDEGVTNECGSCAAECERTCVGAADGCTPFDLENEGSNVVPCEGAENCITLGGRTISLHVIWVANTEQGTVSKIDTRTREEEARYATSGLGPSASPSRTSVDYLGDVVVGNRAFGTQASVARIASEDCPDQNRNGRVETSSGRDDILDWGDDECVLWSTDVGCGPDEGGWGVGCGIARAVAVQDRIGLDGALEERVWVGLFNEQGYYELDRSNGEETGEFADCSPCTPYGAAIDRDGNLWSACLSQNVCRFDTTDVEDAEVLIQPGSNYGITVDEEGRVWTGSSCAMYDPEEETWTSIPGCGSTGVAADGNGSVWFGSCGAGMCRVDTETLELTNIPGAESYGVAVDFDGYIWGVPLGPGFISIVDPETEEVERILDDCAGPCLVGAYTYSDMTGYQLRNATDPQGYYAHVFQGCPDVAATFWTGVSHEATTPVGTSILISVRTADDLGTLGELPWISVGTTAEESPLQLVEALGPGPHGRYLEVRFTLYSDQRETKPQFTGMGAQWYCDVPIG